MRNGIYGQPENVKVYDTQGNEFFSTLFFMVDAMLEMQHKQEDVK